MQYDCPIYDSIGLYDYNKLYLQNLFDLDWLAQYESNDQKEDYFHL
jgi:hypothetical protein